MSSSGSPYVRPYRPEDREGFADVVTSVLTEFGFRVDDLLEADLHDPAARYAAIWVAVHADDVVGTVALRLLEDGTTAELKRMFLRPGYRGRGLGRSLLALALGWAREHGCAAVVLDTSPDMAIARHLYESAGFVQTGTRVESGASDSRCEVLYALALCGDG